MRPRGTGRAAVRVMARVDIGVEPHIERAGGAGAGGDADQRGDGEHRMHRARRGDQPDQSGEHHEKHHPRLHQRDIVGDVAAGWRRRLVSAVGPWRWTWPTHSGRMVASTTCAIDHLMRGSVS